MGKYFSKANPFKNQYLSCGSNRLVQLQPLSSIIKYSMRARVRACTCSRHDSIYCAMFRRKQFNFVQNIAITIYNVHSTIRSSTEGYDDCICTEKNISAVIFVAVNK